MIIISHKGGFTVSRDGHIDIVSELVDTDEGRRVRRKRVAVINNPYTVSGTMTGDVKVAIKDDITGEIKSYNGIVKNELIEIKNETKNNWLWQIK